MTDQFDLKEPPTLELNAEEKELERTINRRSRQHELLKYEDSSYCLVDDGGGVGFNTVEELREYVAETEYWRAYHAEDRGSKS